VCLRVTNHAPVLISVLRNIRNVLHQPQAASFVRSCCIRNHARLSSIGGGIRSTKGFQASSPYLRKYWLRDVALPCTCHFLDPTDAKLPIHANIDISPLPTDSLKWIENIVEKARLAHTTDRAFVVFRFCTWYASAQRRQHRCCEVKFDHSINHIHTLEFLRKSEPEKKCGLRREYLYTATVDT